MEAKDKAKEIFEQYHNHTIDDWTKKQCAIICVNEIVKALEDYGRDSDELQNMDREFAWWDMVIAEINKL